MSRCAPSTVGLLLLCWLLVLLGCRRDEDCLNTNAASRLEVGRGSDKNGQRDDLPGECEETAAYWRRQLTDTGRAIVCPPFVLAGDLEESALRAWCDQVVHPAAMALAERYFKKPAVRPVSILLFHDETAYRSEAKRLFVTGEISRHGFFVPHLNTVVLNAAAGRPALLHELTHALLAFDFPDAPAWLREGLATLHEDCQIDPASAGLAIRPEARRRTLQVALENGQLPSLESLLRKPQFQGPEAPVYYALARHFCLFLDRQAALAPVYRAIRAGKGGGADNAATILRLLRRDSWAELEADFRAWVVKPEGLSGIRDSASFAAFIRPVIDHGV